MGHWEWHDRLVIFPYVSERTTCSGLNSVDVNWCFAIGCFTTYASIIILIQWHMETNCRGLFMVACIHIPENNPTLFIVPCLWHFVLWSSHHCPSTVGDAMRTMFCSTFVTWCMHAWFHNTRQWQCVWNIMHGMWLFDSKQCKFARGVYSTRDLLSCWWGDNIGLLFWGARGHMPNRHFIFRWSRCDCSFEQPSHKWHMRGAICKRSVCVCPESLREVYTFKRLGRNTIIRVGRHV